MIAVKFTLKNGEPVFEINIPKTDDIEVNVNEAMAILSAVCRKIEKNDEEDIVHFLSNVMVWVNLMLLKYHINLEEFFREEKERIEEYYEDYDEDDYEEDEESIEDFLAQFDSPEEFEDCFGVDLTAESKDKLRMLLNENKQDLKHKDDD